MNEHLCARTLSQISNVVPYSSSICTCIIHKLLKRTLDHLCGALQQGFFGCCCHVNCQFNPRIAPRDNQRCTMYTILLWWSWWSINTVSSKIGNLGMSYYVLVHVFIVSILFLFFCGHKEASCGVEKFLRYLHCYMSLRLFVQSFVIAQFFFF